MKFVFYRHPKLFGIHYHHYCGVKANGTHITLGDRAGRLMLALFCHPVLNEKDLMEILWPNPDTMPDQFASATKVLICRLNKRLAPLGVKIISRERWWRIVETDVLEMAA